MAGKGKNAGKKSKNAKGAKVVVSYQKKERPKKETIMILKSKSYCGWQPSWWQRDTRRKKMVW